MGYVTAVTNGVVVVWCLVFHGWDFLSLQLTGHQELLLVSKSEAFESLKLGTITGHEVKTAFKKLELLGSTKKRCEKSGKWEIWGMLESFRSGIVCGSVDMNCSNNLRPS